MFLHSLATELFINKKLYHQDIIHHPNCSYKKHWEPIWDEPEDHKGCPHLFFFLSQCLFYYFEFH